MLFSLAVVTKNSIVLLKVAFFQKVRCVFQTSKRNISNHSPVLCTILNKLFTVMGGKFKFHVQVQNSDLDSFFLIDR
jgi:hypothetical protein